MIQELIERMFFVRNLCVFGARKETLKSIVTLPAFSYAAASVMNNKKSEVFDAASFFDRHAQQYRARIRPTDKPPDVIRDSIEFIKKYGHGNTLLDVGAGSGTFARRVKYNMPDMEVTVMDPSVSLLNYMQDTSIRKIIGKISDLNLTEETFFFIHAAQLLHHLVGVTISESKQIMKDSLLVLRNHLDDGGFLIVREQLWETYVFPTASRDLTFHVLSIANKLGIAVPRFFHPDIHVRSLKGLLVCIYTATELENALEDCDFKIISSKFYQPYPPLKSRKRWQRLALLKRYGVIQLIASA